MMNLRTHLQLLGLALLTLTGCSSTQALTQSTDRMDRMYGWTRELALLEAPDPEDFVRGANAEFNLRYGMEPDEALAFLENHLVTGDDRQKKIAIGLVKVYSRKLNDRRYLQLSPLYQNLDAAALEVDMEHPEALIPLMEALVVRKGLKGKLSDYYQMNDTDAGAGVAYRLAESGRLEIVSYDKYLAMPWVEERDLSLDFNQARRPSRAKLKAQ